METNKLRAVSYELRAFQVIISCEVRYWFSFMKDFKKLKTWQKGMELVKQVYELVGQFPSEEKFSLTTQMTRAAVSIPSNIAEGSAKRSQKDYARFLEIALGSSYELETQVLISDELNYGNKQLRESLLLSIDEEQKMLQSFIKTVVG